MLRTRWRKGRDGGSWEVGDRRWGGGGGGGGGGGK